MSDLLELPGAFSPTPSSDEVVMQFTVARHHLDKALARVHPVVSNTDLLPVLRNFHFQILGEGSAALLRISGSDSVLSAVAQIPVRTQILGGAAVLPSSRLLALVREAESDTLEFTVRSMSGRYSALVKSGKAHWTFPLMAPDGFPDFTEAWDTSTVPVNREEFHSALSRVYRAASQDVMRPYLMMVDVSRGRMRASDSVRFQEVRYDFPIDCQIPVRAAQELVGRLRSSNLEQVEVGETAAALLFRFGVVLLICQKTSAKFPDVDEVLLKPAFANDLELVVDREALLSAVRRVRVTADENTAAVVLSLNHGSVTVECKDRKGGFAHEAIAADWTHAPRHVSFNHQHLCDLLTSTSSDTCQFKLGIDLKTKPTPLLMEDPEERFTAVLSQIRLDWL